MVLLKGRVYLPAPLDSVREVTMQHLRDNLKSVTEEYVQSPEYGSSVHKNLTREQKDGLRSLKKKVKQKDVVIYQTDKSGRFSVDTMDNYREACSAHVEGDQTITVELHEKAQKMANTHSTMWVRIFKAGEAIGGQARIKRNMLVEGSTLAPLYALRKDHKGCDSPARGPPMRPVCGAVSAYNSKLSHA